MQKGTCGCNKKSLSYSIDKKLLCCLCGCYKSVDENYLANRILFSNIIDKIKNKLGLVNFKDNNLIIDENSFTFLYFEYSIYVFKIENFYMVNIIYGDNFNNSFFEKINNDEFNESDKIISNLIYEKVTNQKKNCYCCDKRNDI